MPLDGKRLQNLRRVSVVPRKTPDNRPAVAVSSPELEEPAMARVLNPGMPIRRSISPVPTPKPIAPSSGTPSVIDNLLKLAFLAVIALLGSLYLQNLPHYQYAGMLTDGTAVVFEKSTGNIELRVIPKVPTGTPATPQRWTY